MRICTKATSVYKENDYFVIKTNAIDLHLWFVTDEIIRIRAGFDGSFTEESYSLALTAWPDRLDDLMASYRRRINPADANLSLNENSAILEGRALTVTIEYDPFRILLFDKDHDLLHADVIDLGYQEDSNKRRIHTSEIQPGDHFYGFGEKSGHLDKLEESMSMSPKDTMGYNPEKSDSLYKHIPFYIKANENTKKAIGYFYHNTAECDFDMGREHSNYWVKHSRYRVDQGDIDLFLIAGPSVSEVTSRYTMLTGRPALLPKYALGYLGSSMYYPELPRDCDEAILHFVETARAEDIPMDGFQLSSGYTQQETAEGQKRCVFTWNHNRFKDPTAYFSAMKKRGITVSPNVKPGILLAHPNIKDFTTANMLVKDSESDEPAIGNWWGGKGVFADFTNPTCRAIWKQMLTDHVLRFGTDSIWNDNCEYDSIVDKDARCDFDGNGGTIGNLKSVMSNLMCHVTAEAISEEFKDTRPYIVCRSGHSGIQRYAQSWAGDNRTSFASLRYNVATILGMSLSGVMNYGADIGGFYGPAPSPELLVRWVQNGIFQPRFSIHSVNTDNTVTEPWMYPSVTPLIRDAIKFRYQLFPYFYSLMWRANQTGEMILKPYLAINQADPSCYSVDDSFFLGDGLLVANVLEEGATERDVYLPQGDNYYDLYSHRKYNGGQTITVPVDLSSIPLFLRSGAILPMALNQMHNLSTEEANGYFITIVADQDSTFTLYEDDGLSRAYEHGEFSKTHITVESGLHTIITLRQEGSYPSSCGNLFLDVISGETSAPFFVRLGDELLPQYLYQPEFASSDHGWYYDMDSQSLRIKYKEESPSQRIEISYENFDMLGM